jgi:hypothetical protein
MNDLRERMEAVGEYSGLKPLHVVNFVSGKKMAKTNIYTITGIKGEYSNIDKNISINNSRGLRKPQVIPDMKENPTVTLNRQIKKNMLANVEDSTDYILNSGVAGKEVEIKGDRLKDLLHSAIEEKLNRDINSAIEELKITDLNIKNLSNEQRLEILKNARKIVFDQIVDKDMHSNYIKGLDITYGEDGLPAFSIPLDLPTFAKKYEPILMSILNNRAFKQKVKGYEGVQVAQFGGFGESGRLKFYQIGDTVNKKQKRLIHAEIEIREDLALRFGIEPGTDLELSKVPEELLRLIGYRIPNQDKASTIILKIKRLLPKNYEKAIIVPPQIVKLMGSDFDVDKLFLMFPELFTDKNGVIYKINPDYKGYISGKKSIGDMTDKELNNIIFDSMEAVMSNQSHFVETLSPLDDLKSEQERIRRAIPELGVDLDWNNYKTESKYILRNQAGNKLRGIYANIISGRNVVQHGVLSLVDNFAIKLADDAGNITVLREYIKKTSTGLPTDKVASLFLSGAVDASKDPVQYELNDNLTTSKVRALFLGFQDDPKSEMCTNFLNQPIIREFIEFFENKYSADPSQVRQALIKFKTSSSILKNNPELQNMLDFDNGKTTPIKLSEISNLKQDYAERDVKEQANILHNFYQFYKAGNNLLKLYKRVTPDSMDGLNLIGNIQSYKDKSEFFDEGYDEDGSKNTFFIGPVGIGNPVDQFVGENSIYKYQRGYENLMNKALEVAKILFPIRLSPGVQLFKKSIRSATSYEGGINQIDSVMHRQVDSNIMFMLMSQPGSPLAKYFTEDYSKELYASANNNIYTQIEAIKKEFPALNGNIFLTSFEKDYDMDNKYFGVKFKGSENYKAIDKEKFTQSLENMIYFPQMYLTNPTQENMNKIKSIGIKLVIHNFLTNGFNKGASSYEDIIPARYLTQKQEVIVNEVEKRVSISDYFKELEFKLQDENFFTGLDLVKYMSMFGGMKAGGKGLTQRSKNKGLNEKTWMLELDSSNRFVFVYNPKTFESGVFMKIAKDSNKFLRLHKLFSSKKIYSLANMTQEELERKDKGGITYEQYFETALNDMNNIITSTYEKDSKKSDDSTTSITC